jgi:hypothetical protein
VQVNGQDGADAILIDDTDIGFIVNSHTYTINTTGVGRDGRSLLFYNTVESLDVNAGSGNDDITVLGSQATLTVRAGLGNDVFHVGGIIPFGLGHVTLGDLNGTTFLDLSKTIDDGAADYLDGGTDLDWSFRFNGDTTLVETGERVNQEIAQEQSPTGACRRRPGVLRAPGRID